MSTITRELLLVPVPSLGGLRPAQVQGDACPWCAVPLDSTAMNLGRRSGTLMGIVLPWEPRAHADCVRGAALRELPVHAGKCRTCNGGGTCVVRRALRRLAWEDS